MLPVEEQQTTQRGVEGICQHNDYDFSSQELFATSRGAATEATS